LCLHPEVARYDDPSPVSAKLAANKAFVFQQPYNSIGVVRHVTSMIGQVWISSPTCRREKDLQSLSTGDHMQPGFNRALEAARLHQRPLELANESLSEPLHHADDRSSPSCVPQRGVSD
jgi:hypothetical protein